MQTAISPRTNSAVVMINSAVGSVIPAFFGRMWKNPMVMPVNSTMGPIEGEQDPRGGQSLIFEKLS